MGFKYRRKRDALFLVLDSPIFWIDQAEFVEGPPDVRDGGMLHHDLTYPVASTSIEEDGVAFVHLLRSGCTGYMRVPEDRNIVPLDALYLWSDSKQR